MKTDLFGNAIIEEVPIDVKKKSVNPFDYVNKISSKIRPENFEDYNPFLTNLSFSQRKDLVFYANEMNRYHHLGNLEQFDFYFHSLPKKNLFSKWAKKTNVEHIEAIKQYFNVSEKIALTYEKVLTEKDKETISRKVATQKGGNNK